MINEWSTHLNVPQEKSANPASCSIQIQNHTSSARKWASVLIIFYAMSSTVFSLELRASKCSSSMFWVYGWMSPARKARLGQKGQRPQHQLKLGINECKWITSLTFGLGFCHVSCFCLIRPRWPSMPRRDWIFFICLMLFLLSLRSCERAGAIQRVLKRGLMWGAFQNNLKQLKTVRNRSCEWKMFKNRRWNVWKLFGKHWPVWMLSCPCHRTQGMNHVSERSVIWCDCVNSPL